MTDYPPGFLLAWKAYPHYLARSKKKMAAKVWDREGLEPQLESVLAWIAYCKQPAGDWASTPQYVPGMQVWLNGRDFEELPPAAQLEDRPGIEPYPPEMQRLRDLIAEEKLAGDKAPDQVLEDARRRWRAGEVASVAAIRAAKAWGKP